MRVAEPGVIAHQFMIHRILDPRSDYGIQKERNDEYRGDDDDRADNPASQRSARVLRFRNENFLFCDARSYPNKRARSIPRRGQYISRLTPRLATRCVILTELFPPGGTCIKLAWRRQQCDTVLANLPQITCVRRLRWRFISSLNTSSSTANRNPTLFTLPRFRLPSHLAVF
jgi:hypothetical protein